MTTEVKDQIQIIPVENRLEPKLQLMKANITPELAQKLLKKMLPNRNVKSVNLDELVGSIKGGYWDAENGETIKIREDGYVTDGQHRLLAIIEANQAVPMYIILNTSAEAMTSVDTGRSRSLSDILKIDGQQYYTAKPSVIQSESAYIQGYGSTNMHDYTKIQSWQKVLEIARKHEGYLNEVCKKANLFNSYFPLISTNQYAKIYNVLLKINEDKANDFMHDLTANHPRSLPVQLLRKKLMLDSVTRQKKMSPREKEAFIILTWNKWYTGTDVRKLVWRSESGFPKIQGVKLIKNPFTK